LNTTNRNPSMKKNFRYLHCRICSFISFFFLFVVSGSSQTLLRDTEFNNNSSTTNSETRCIEVLDHGAHKGKVLAAGFFNGYNGNFSYSKLVRLNRDGTVDATFAAQSYSGAGIYTVAVQPWDNKILIGGSFSKTVDGITYQNIMRLNEDGSVDNTFNPLGGGTDGVVWKILVLDELSSINRRIVIGGVYNAYKGSVIAPSGDRGGVILVRENGNLAKNLHVNKGAWAAGGVYCMALDFNGDILVGGEFGLVNGVRARRAVRLKRNGDLDPAFINIGYDGVGPGGTVFSIAAQPSDNKILIGGAFTSYVDMTIGQNVDNVRTRIARLNYDGTLDKDFNFSDGNFLSRGFNDNNVRDFLVHSSGKILVAGNFTSYGGINVNRIARLNPDGSLDNTLNIGTGFDNIVHDIAFYNYWRDIEMAEAQILVAGNFVRYNSYEGQSNLVRLRNSEVLSASVSDFSVLKVSDKKVRISWKMLAHNAQYALQRSFDGRSFETIKIFKSSGTENVVTTFDEVTSGIKVYYRVEVNTGSTGFTITPGIKDYTPTLSVIMNSSAPIKMWRINNTQLKIGFGSDAVVHGNLHIQVIDLSGQIINEQTFVRNRNSYEQIVPLTGIPTRSFVILKDNKGTVLAKVYLP